MEKNYIVIVVIFILAIKPLWKLSLYILSKFIKVDPVHEKNAFAKIEQENNDSTDESLGKLITLSDLVSTKKKTKLHKYRDSLGYSRSERVEVEVTIHPKVKKIKNGIQVLFDESVSNKEITKEMYTDYIADLFFREGITKTKELKAVRTAHPYRVNYFHVHPKVKIFNQDIDDDAEYELKLNKLINKDNAEIFLGEPEVNLNVDDQVVWSLTQSPHLMVVGQTRSGKTMTVLSLVTQIASIYPSASFLFADGKDSVDYNPFADNLSEYPVAKIQDGDDALVHFAFIINVAWTEYRRRKSIVDKFATSKKVATSTYIEYNKHNQTKINQLYLVIDEFSAFNKVANSSVKSLIRVKGNPYYQLNRLLREAASVGITIIISSQRAQETDFPSEIKANLTTNLIHSVGAKDAQYLGVEGRVEKQKTGGFVLRIPGLFCEDTGENLINCRLPFVGKSPKKIYSLNRDLVKKKFDDDYIFNTGSETDYGKLPPNSLKKYVKNLFCMREGFEVLTSKDAEHDHISLVVKKGAKKYAIGFIDADEMIDETFYARLNRFLTDEEKHIQKIFFVRGNITSKAKETNINELVDTNGDIALIQQDYVRLLKKAKKLYDEASNEEIFTALLGVIKDTEAQESLVINKKDAEIGNIEISINELERINQLPGKSDNQKAAKGEQFERFVHALFRHLGWTTYVPDHLFAKRLYKRPGDVGDLGLDMLLVKTDKDLRELTQEEADERIAVQIKNWNSVIPAKVLGEVLRSFHNFKCLKNGTSIKNGMIISSSTYSSYTKLEAENQGITLIGYTELRKLVIDATREAHKDGESVRQISIADLDRDDQIAHFHAQGLSLRAIAKQLGIKSHNTVRSVLKKRGIL